MSWTEHCIERIGQAELEGLAGIQGNILKPFARKYSRLVFISLREPGEQAENRRLVSELVDDLVTSASEQFGQTVVFNARRVRRAEFSGEPAAMIGFSQSGLEALGEPPREWCGRAVQTDLATDFRTDSDIVARHDGWTGFEWRSGFSMDWEPEYRQPQHDIVIYMADDDPTRLGSDLQNLEQRLTVVAYPPHVEEGSAFAHPDLESKGFVEHFGFRDGISRPVFFKKDEQRMLGQATVTNQLHPPAAVLAREERLYAGAEGFGSVLSFLKIEQDVDAFSRRARCLADRSARQLDEMAARELAVGRRRSGAPLVQRSGGQPVKDWNLFRYDSRGAQTECPVHSHVRRMNARRIPGVLDEGAEPRQAFVRRSALYGAYDKEDVAGGEPVYRPQGPVGLLFMAFQRSLDGFHQRMSFARPRAAHNEGDGSAGSHDLGLDPVLGRQRPDDGDWDDCARSVEKGEAWPLPGGGTVRARMGNVVTIRGGGVFYMPSMHFLRSLADPPGPTPDGPIIT